jgi:hypothetical protein
MSSITHAYNPTRDYATAAMADLKLEQNALEEENNSSCLSVALKVGAVALGILAVVGACFFLPLVPALIISAVVVLGAGAALGCCFGCGGGRHSVPVDDHHPGFFQRHFVPMFGRFGENMMRAPGPHVTVGGGHERGAPGLGHGRGDRHVPVGSGHDRSGMGHGRPDHVHPRPEGFVPGTGRGHVTVGGGRR